jgi:tetratricopeptide (TPR) repeat protein
MKTTITQILAFVKQLRVLAWLETFEKWFGFFVKLIWIGAFLAFSIYLYNEYHKNIFYLKDFKVPNEWADQGYTGDVVKESILDEIDKIKQETADYWDKNKSIKSTRSKDKDNTQILSDINVEGFNLKAIVKTILSVLGKKDKSIGGYVTLNDSLQVMSIQITDQVTKRFNIDRKKPVKMLIRDATLHIMRIKQPLVLLTYYQVRNDTLAMKEAYTYLVKNRDITRDFDFYYASFVTSGFERDFDKAEAWADSLIEKFPNAIAGYKNKAYIYSFRKYLETDSLKKEKYGQLQVAYLKKAVMHNNTYDGEKIPLNDLYIELADYYFRNKNDTLGIEYLEKSSKIEALPSYTSNYLGYIYIKQKKYAKAEIAIKSATKDSPDNGNYWDSMGELYALQGKDSIAVMYLNKALKAPIKSATVSIEAYKKDSRWQRLQKRNDFQLLLRK